MKQKKKLAKAGRPKKVARRSPAHASGQRLRIIFSARQIQQRVRAIARQIDRDYHGKTLHVVGILEDCFLFMADLVRQIKTPLVCHFVRAEIHDETSSGGNAVRAIHYIPKFEATGKDVLLVDGLLQSGVTLDHLVRSMMAQEPNSVRIAALVEKSDELKVDVKRDYVGFQTRGKFLMGYGLGYEGRYRNLSYIATLK